MSTESHTEDGVSSGAGGEPPTVAPFSPNYPPNSLLQAKQRATILVHQKSPLLVATPPRITRALAYSHPFLLPLNKLAGLLSWTTGDPWESFLLLAGFWAATLYGDVVVRWAGPIVVVLGLMLGLYTRRYSPLSSTGWISEKGGKGHLRKESEGKIRHQKSLDEIVETVRLFTSRCNILLDPFLRLTDFLSTQRTATAATTRPALTVLFLRILLITPLWYVLTLPPLYIITTKRVVLTSGTLVLSWHSSVARVARTILWRSRLVRRAISVTTGLDFGDPSAYSSTIPSLTARPSISANHAGAAERAKSANASKEGIRFTFVLYENQRRWIGIGWTTSMLAYERAAWSDEHLNFTQPKDSFELPKVDGGHAKWQWVEGSEWEVDEDEQSTAAGKNDKKKGGSSVGSGGWVYYDNHWRDGRRGQDGWGRYTRRRKWCRDAELVETDAQSGETTPAAATTTVPPTDRRSIYSDDGPSTPGKRGGWFKKTDRGDSSKASQAAGDTGSGSGHSGNGSFSLAVDRDDDSEDSTLPPQLRAGQPRQSDWGIGDDVSMELG